MKKHFYLWSFIFLFSCQSQKEEKISTYRTNFTQEEKDILKIVDSVIKSAYYATLITLDKDNQPRARIVEPFLPKDNYVIWVGTNPKSRKVTQLKHNSKTTLHYFDKNKLAYVSLMGNAFLINDAKTKQEIWKEGWERFYPNRKTDYLLIKFIPKTIELISITDNYTGDKTTWKPHQVALFNK